ncbi:guanine nucleotide-binding protein-like NSN1 isoform X1 [Brachypodium distachyon]|uniref:guanine nucleotide-binding protein-like NSN1 isoform X1 n=1 Tax=Brachypodium distachyon TaxID=15368 RepID=UPI0001C76E75|nr:guanine nucleotide-binding protein-like NSN1 isoform X1 [Brachypodium distachyon]|eukprot:XP_003558915.1 guanine nucleotide-binding protein-like NSN1 isoform X1 [Brachypodium distachyon]
MVKKSKKSKSKRVTLKQKHKVLRKVKEHHRKKRKEARKDGKNHKSKVEKDPGIPNEWPFKEQELKALEVRRAQALKELELKKEARKERARKRKLGLPEDEDLPEEKKDAAKENASLELPKTNDHSERAFYKELVKVIEASDVILEVLDARDPLGTRCIDMEKMVRKTDPTKRIVLLLNKIDLVPKESVEKWLTYLREELPTVAFKCNTQEQRTKLGWKSSKLDKTSNVPQRSDCLGAENLIKLLKNYSRSHELKLAITVGIVGLPNVGKSSLINSLKRSRVVNVGSTPGVTRSMQEVQLDRKVKLLDCPGVVMLKSSNSGVSVALRNCKRVEKMEDLISPVKEILNLCPHEKLMSLYNMPSFTSVDDFLQKVATLRGKLKKGGIVDVEAAAKIVLHDWNEGKIPYYTLPPKRDAVEDSDAVIISEDGKEFNVDEIYKAESSYISGLKSILDFSHIEIPSNAPPEIDEEMLEDGTTQGEPVKENCGVESMPDVKDPEGSKPTSGSSTQHDKLYAAEGILDPRKKKAEKKRRKGNSKSSLLNDMDADYDFNVDYQMKDAPADDDEKNGGGDEPEAMAGVDDA